MKSRSLLVSASFFAALAGTAGMASAASSVAAGCEKQSNAPIVVHRALPDVADMSSSPARTVVAVHLARTGRSSAILLSRSSGSPAFDQAALAAARASSFAPAAHSCVAHDATFQYAIARGTDGHLTTAVVEASGN